MKVLERISVFQNYGWKQFRKDVLAGIIVGIVALPLSISFSIASGITPEIGIITTIVSGFIIAVLSGSSVQIGGPTAACIVIIYGIIIQYGISGLVIATFLAGLILILMGVLKLGRVIRLIPDPLIEGFTAGIAIDLFSSQLKDFFGLKMASLPIDFVDKCVAYFHHFSVLNYYAIGLGCSTILINQTSPYIFTRKVPGPLISITTTTLIAYFFHFPVETIGSKFGPMALAYPKIVIPHFDIKIISDLMRPAFAIAILVSVMSLLSGMVAERTVGKTFHSNKELIAQGIANLLASLLGGIPVTGSLARTQTNFENGARTPIAGITQSVTLLIILLLINRWIAYIPVASIAGLLVVVAYNMGKWKTVRSILKSWSGDTLLLLITFLSTIFINLTVALEAGLIFASFQFMIRMSRTSKVNELTNNFLADNGYYIEERIVKLDIPKDIAVYEINGPLFFAAAHKFKESFNAIQIKPKIVIIRMRNVPYIDSTGIRTIYLVEQTLNSKNIKIVIAEYNYNNVEEKLSNLLISKIGKENIYGTLNEAVTRGKEILGLEIDD